MLTPIEESVKTMTVMNATEGTEYVIREIAIDDEALTAFLFTLGCYSGQPITVISRLRNSCIISIKDSRYNIDRQLAEAIYI